MANHRLNWFWALAVALALHAWALSAWWPATGAAKRATVTKLAPQPPLLTRSLPIAAEPSKKPKSVGKPLQTQNYERNPHLVTGFIESVATKNVASVEHDSIPPNRASVIPAPVQLRYQVSGQHRGRAIESSAVLDWQHDGASFDARLDVGQWFAGPRVSRSIGSLSVQGLSPSRYAERGRGERAVHLDAAQARVSYSNNRSDAAWVEGMQDPLSSIVQLSAWLSADAAQFSPARSVSMPATGLGGAGVWVFRVESALADDLPRQLRFAAPPNSALKFTRELRGEFDAKLELWFAKATNWSLVRMRVTRENADVMDLQLQPN